MLKKIIRDILIVAGIAAMAISTSHKCMDYISDKRDEVPAWWGTHTALQGDLVHMSYLDMVKKFCAIRDYAFVKPDYHKKAQINLYTFGDSYTFKVPDTAYAGILSYSFAWRSKADLRYSLDTTRKNILSIEISERYVREYFNDLNIYKYVYDSAKKDKVAIANSLPVPPVQHAAIIPLDVVNKLFNPLINQNLEYNLFNYNFLNPVMESKALLNFTVFGRASGDVVISDNKQALFLKETVLEEGWPSSYAPVSDDDIAHLVANLNAIYDHYKADGFNEVYLAIIPNAATIEQSRNYNGLIPRIQANRDLRMKIIDVYSAFINAKEKLYRPGDTHWNNNGLQKWLHIVNDSLIYWNER